MVLFIPGYLLIAALFPKKEDLESIERVALSFGLSIAVVPLIGLFLNYTIFGIRLIPILASLIIFDIGMILLTNYRRNKLSDNSQFYLNFNSFLKSIKEEFGKDSKMDHILTGILIFSMVLAIGMLIYVITVPKIGEKFTEFYILNASSGKADGYPSILKVNDPTTIKTGVVNHEYSLINYTVQIELGNESLGNEKISLENNQTWEKNFNFLANKTGKDEKLEFLLYKENNFTVPYRELHLWVNVI
jgi:uncharacterized membrane protein